MCVPGCLRCRHGVGCSARAAALNLARLRQLLQGNACQLAGRSQSKPAQQMLFSRSSRHFLFSPHCRGSLPHPKKSLSSSDSKFRSLQEKLCKSADKIQHMMIGHKDLAQLCAMCWGDFSVGHPFWDVVPDGDSLDILA